jgi:uncharacterized protein (TIGR00369 family)
MPVMDAVQIERFVVEQFPQISELQYRIEEVGEGTLRVRLPYDDMLLRPGGTISGPALMALADSATYFLILSMIGPVGLAVTTSLHIDFLRKPKPADVVADAEILKLGSRLAIARVSLRSHDDTEPVAHASVTYSIPPKRKAA